MTPEQLSDATEKKLAFADENIRIRACILDESLSGRAIPDPMQRASRRIERFLTLLPSLRFRHVYVSIMDEIPLNVAARICAQLRGPWVWRGTWLPRRQWRLEMRRTGKTYVFSEHKVNVVIKY